MVYVSDIDNSAKANHFANMFNNRAEVFTLNIAGSLPTLRPLYSQIRGHLPSGVASALSWKKSKESGQGTGEDGFHTIGSDGKSRRSKSRQCYDRSSIHRQHEDTKNSDGTGGGIEYGIHFANEPSGCGEVQPCQRHSNPFHRYIRHWRRWWDPRETRILTRVR